MFCSVLPLSLNMNHSCYCGQQLTPVFVFLQGFRGAVGPEDSSKQHVHLHVTELVKEGDNRKFTLHNRMYSSRLDWLDRSAALW